MDTALPYDYNSSENGERTERGVGISGITLNNNKHSTTSPKHQLRSHTSKRQRRHEYEHIDIAPAAIPLTPNDDPRDQASLLAFYEMYAPQLTSLKSMIRIARAYLGDKSRHNDLPVVLQVLEIWCDAMVDYAYDYAYDGADSEHDDADADITTPQAVNANTTEDEDDGNSIMDNRNNAELVMVDEEFKRFLIRYVRSLPRSNTEYVAIEGYLVAGCIAYVSGLL